MEKHLITDSEIIELLLRRDESALQLITDKYRSLYRSVIREMLSNENDVVECENDLLLAIWNSIPPNRPENLAAYISALARRGGISRFRYNTRQKRSEGYTVILSELDEVLPNTDPSVQDMHSDENIANIISDFLRSADIETRILFIRRYVYLESVSEISKRYKISENNISVKLHRARVKLKKLLEKEGISL